MRLTGEGIWGWPPDRENAKKVLRRAVELGVNFIDTAAFHRMWAAPQRPKNARNLRRSYPNSWSFPRKLSGLHESAAADRYASPARTRLPARRSRVNSLWFLFAEFLEARIIPKGIEHWIEPEQRRSERQVVRKFSIYCFGAREATIFSKRGSFRSGSQKGSSLGVASGVRRARVPLKSISIL